MTGVDPALSTIGVTKIAYMRVILAASALPLSLWGHTPASNHYIFNMSKNCVPNVHRMRYLCAGLCKTSLWLRKLLDHQVIPVTVSVLVLPGCDYNSWILFLESRKLHPQYSCFLDGLARDRILDIAPRLQGADFFLSHFRLCYTFCYTIVWIFQTLFVSLRYYLKHYTSYSLCLSNICLEKSE